MDNEDYFVDYDDDDECYDYDDYVDYDNDDECYDYDDYVDCDSFDECDYYDEDLYDLYRYGFLDAYCNNTLSDWLREGKYIVGEDIEPGTYTLTCTETAGGKMKDAYGALGSAMDALDGSQGYGSMFGALGGMLEEVADMTVEILGDYGDVLKSWNLKAGDSMSIALKEETALRITDGSCTIVAAG